MGSRFEDLILHCESLGLLSLLGMAIGAMFGFAAQRSGFCMRAAAIEVWRGAPGERWLVWLTAASTAILLTQGVVSAGLVDTSAIGKLSNPSSLSAAALGGLLFGIGMVLSRGCVSRLLVLSGSGNTRALLTLLIVAVVVQTALTGGLAPLRLEIREWWVLPAKWSTLSASLPPFGGVALGTALLLLALWRNYRRRLTVSSLVTALVIGAMPALALLVTSEYAAHSFDIVAVEGISFAGPAGQQLTALMTDTDPSLGFSGGLIVGVFLGALVSALISKRFEWQYFTEESGTARYVLGAVLMGFGATLVTGCSVGAGLTDSALLLHSAWLAVLFMWLGVGLADRAWDRGPNLLAQRAST